MNGNMVPVVFFVCSALVAIGWPIARAVARRIDRDAAVPRIPADLASRLERIEAAVDSVAIEVERIAEGQRFVTRLLADPAAPREPPRPTEGLP